MSEYVPDFSANLLALNLISMDEFHYPYRLYLLNNVTASLMESARVGLLNKMKALDLREIAHRQEPLS